MDFEHKVTAGCIEVVEVNYILLQTVNSFEVGIVVKLQMDRVLRKEIDYC